MVEGTSIPSFFVRCHMDVALNGYLVQTTAEAQHRTGLTVKLELSDEDAAFREELRRIYTTEIPDELNVLGTYPIAPLAESAQPELAQAFVDLVLSDEGQAILTERGFQAPE